MTTANPSGNVIQGTGLRLLPYWYWRFKSCQRDGWFVSCECVLHKYRPLRWANPSSSGVLQSMYVCAN